MSDRSFQMFVAFAILVMVVVMSTPLTGAGLSHLAERVLHQPTATSVAPEPIAVARN